MTLIILSALLSSCRNRVGTSTEPKLASELQTDLVSGKITDVKCSKFNHEEVDSKLKNSCVLEVTQDNGEILMVVSDDVYTLTPEQKQSLSNRPLAVYNDLFVPINNEKVLTLLSDRFGARPFLNFFGDIPWLCHNKMGPTGKCGLSFSLSYVASKEVLTKAEEKLLALNLPTYEQAEIRRTEVLRGNPALSEEEKNAVFEYTRSVYKAVNSALRTNDPAQIQEWNDFIGAAVSGLRKLDKFEGNVVRGIRSSDERAKPYVDAFNLDEPIQELAFMSTAYAETGLFDGFVTFKIRSHSAAKLDTVSNAPEEKEALFAPGTWFRVTGVSTGDLVGVGTNPPVTIEMVELVIMQ